MKKIEITIPGNPPRKTHQSGTHIGRGRTYKDQALRDAEAYLVDGLRPWVPDLPWSGPVSLTVQWAWRPSVKKESGSWKTTRPDTDNLQKTLKDVMTRLRFWEDDSQVCHEEVTKVWSLDPGIKIIIRCMNEES